MRIATLPRSHTTQILHPEQHKATRIAAAVLLVVPLLAGACVRKTTLEFDGRAALELAERQLAFGPRIPGTPGHAETSAWIESSLAMLGWETNVHDVSYQGVELHNVVGRRGTSEDGPLVIGAHYDTRPRADRDPVSPDVPVPGANDGASGVGVLLELARVLPPDLGGLEIWLVFFDGEDSGGLGGWQWSAGSTAFVADLAVTPQAVVIVDMVGDADLRLPRERSSDPGLVDEIWNIAAGMGADAFVQEPGVTIMDDHWPFLLQGIPAADIIDLDYAYWHTTADTLDKISGESLQQVGRVIQAWILSRR